MNPFVCYRFLSGYDWSLQSLTLWCTTSSLVTHIVLVAFVVAFRNQSWIEIWEDDAPCPSTPETSSTTMQLILLQVHIGIVWTFWTSSASFCWVSELLLLLLTSAQNAKWTWFGLDKQTEKAQCHLHASALRGKRKRLKLWTFQPFSKHFRLTFMNLCDRTECNFQEKGTRRFASIFAVWLAVNTCPCPCQRQFVCRRWRDSFSACAIRSRAWWWGVLWVLFDRIECNRYVNLSDSTFRHQTEIHSTWF